MKFPAIAFVTIRSVLSKTELVCKITNNCKPTLDDYESIGNVCEIGDTITIFDEIEINDTGEKYYLILQASSNKLGWLFYYYINIVTDD